MTLLQAHLQVKSHAQALLTLMAIHHPDRMQLLASVFTLACSTIIWLLLASQNL